MSVWVDISISNVFHWGISNKRTNKQPLQLITLNIAICVSHQEIYVSWSHNMPLKFARHVHSIMTYTCPRIIFASFAKLKFCWFLQALESVLTSNTTCSNDSTTSAPTCTSWLVGKRKPRRTQTRQNKGDRQGQRNAYNYHTQNKTQNIQNSLLEEKAMPRRDHRRIIFRQSAHGKLSRTVWPHALGRGNSASPRPKGTETATFQQTTQPHCRG